MNSCMCNSSAFLFGSQKSIFTYSEYGSTTQIKYTKLSSNTQYLFRLLEIHRYIHFKSKHLMCLLPSSIIFQIGIGTII